MLSGPARPWRVTASISGGLVQISNHHETRVIRKSFKRGQPLSCYGVGCSPRVPDHLKALDHVWETGSTPQ